MTQVFHVLDSGPGPAAFNMALDEALLESVVTFGAPVLRFYGWSEEAASFGYFQKYHEAASWTHLRPLVRRPTGGGLVLHDRDWTYSLVFPPSHWWYATSASQSYQAIHQWIRASFALLAVPAELSENQSKVIPGRCFAGAEKHDLLLEGQKIAGAAQRRNRQGLLIQGSVQPRQENLLRQEWQRAMIETSPIGEAEIWKDPREMAPATLAAAGRLTVEKYTQAPYNERR